MPTTEQTAWFLCHNKFPSLEDIDRRLFCICARLKCDMTDARILDERCCKLLKKPHIQSLARTKQAEFIRQLFQKDD